MIELFEKIPVKIFPTANDGSIMVAVQIATLIKDKQAKKENCVLGMATGSTPILLFKELVRLHKEEGLSFKNVITINLDEYYPIHKTAYQSYWSFMHRHFFSQVDIHPENIHIPNGEWAQDQIKELCAGYELIIEKSGGIDLQILGIGKNGHIGFNEPGSSFHSKTRVIHLDQETRIANTYEFHDLNKVPKLAITVGISSIMKAKKIVLLAWGSKADIIAKAVEGNITEQVPASVLQNHDDCTFVIDEIAATDLTRHKSPWLTGSTDWTPTLIKKAVIELALKLDKTILSLTANDYTENSLADLLVLRESVYDINLQVFYMLRDTITGWPGGKPNVVIPAHPERSNPFPKKVLIFSPHPDDDIISMGGTFMRLQDQGHDVHVGYQTSGNIAVTDEFVTRFLDFAVGFEDEERSFLPASKMLEFFGKSAVRLITNNPKKSKDLENLGIHVLETVPTYFNPNEFNAEYLQVKKEKMGHTI